MNSVLAILRITSVATLITIIATTTQTATASETTSSDDGCSYRDANFNDGWGFITLQVQAVLLDLRQVK